MRYFLWCTLWILALMTSCTPEPKKTISPETKANSSSSGTKSAGTKIKMNGGIYRPTELLTAEISHQQPEVPDSLVIQAGNTIIGTFQKPDKTIQFKLDYHKTGRTNLQFKLYWPNNIGDVVQIPITIHSDIAPQKFGYRIVKTYVHNPNYYTQGLEFADGILYEGTGQWNESGLYKWDLDKNEVLQSVNLSDEMFGEGITILGDKVFQLTWRSNIGFAYDKNSFKKLYDFNYPTEGWGLTNNGKELIMSDGSETLYFMDPELFQEIHRIYVYDTKGPVNNLNELEFIDGLIYANIYTTNTIIAIEPETGKVIKTIDLTGLLNKVKTPKRIDVLNGIAYDKLTKRFIVTGKWWPLLFEIELVPKK